MKDGCSPQTEGCSPQTCEYWYCYDQSKQDLRAKLGDTAFNLLQTDDDINRRIAEIDVALDMFERSKFACPNAPKNKNEPSEQPVLFEDETKSGDSPAFGKGCPASVRVNTYKSIMVERLQSGPAPIGQKNDGTERIATGQYL